MSAFQVSARHIAILVDAGISGTFHILDVSEQLIYCKILAKMNADSVNARYPDSESFSPPVDRFPLPLKSGFDKLSPVEILKAIQCYEYQSCETEEWEGSLAYKYCKRLTAKVIADLNGYDDAKWCYEN